MGLGIGMHLTGLVPTILYLGGLLVFLASILWRPEAGLYYLIPLLPLQTLRFRLHDFPLGSHWIDLILVGVLIGVLRKRDSVFTKTSLRSWIFVFGIVTYIALWRGAFFLDLPLPLWFSDPRMSDWKNYMVIFIFFFLVLACIKNVKQMQILLVLMCISILSLNRSYISTMKNRDLSSFSYNIRDEGAMGYAGVNGLAALEAQFSVFLMGLYCVHKEKLPRIGYLLVIGTCIVALMYTFSRGGYASLLLGTAFIAVLKNKKLLILLAIFLVTWQTIVPGAVRERVFMTHDSASGELDPSAGVRVTLWENAMEIFQGDPIFGTGFDTYKYMHAVGPYEDTHNYYIKLLVETGVIGLVLFLGIVTRMFMAGFKLFRSKPAEFFMGGIGLGLAGMMVATLVGNSFGDRWTYIEETGFTWVIVAMAVRCQMIHTGQAALQQPVEEIEEEPAAVPVALGPAGWAGG